MATEELNPTEEKEIPEAAKEPYKNKDGSINEADMKHARMLAEQINADLELREQASLVFNGIPYSQAYLYNQRKAINYSPPKSSDDRQISTGLEHEKIIAFCAIFLKYVFKRRVKCYDDKGNLVRGMGDIYALAIEVSRRLEEFKKLLGLIYWEVFTQGDAWVLEEWDVRTFQKRDAYNDKGEKVKPEDVDYTYEFLEGLSYKEGKTIQTRRARARLLDGRQVILGNPEIEEVQDQPRWTLEEDISDEDAEKIYGTLARWEQVPDTTQDINTVTGMEKSTLFDATRLKDPTKRKLVHRVFDKENNRFNILINGVMMLPKDTPLDFFYPRGNYPLTGVHAERVKGSSYSRSVPAKTKFNADFVNWALKQLALKFEQGVIPAILAKGKYTLTRDIFRAGQVTHGVSKADYEKADPDNKGVTASEFSFVKLLKEIMEGQTLNSTTTGEVSDQATATAVNQAQSNQIEKLGYLLDGIVNGFMDMDLRRAETVESKYTIKQRETIVNGKKVAVYQNFTVNIDGVEHQVMFDEEVGAETYDVGAKRDELFKQSFKEKKKGYPTEFYLVNPDKLRYSQYGLDIEIHPERIKDTQAQMIMMWDEFKNLVGIFQNRVSMPELQKLYLEVSGRPDSLFIPEEMAKLNEAIAMQGGEAEPQNMGSLGRGRQPRVKEAIKSEAAGRR